jgi:hypothetical protein
MVTTDGKHPGIGKNGNACHIANVGIAMIRSAETVT